MQLAHFSSINEAKTQTFRHLNKTHMHGRILKAKNTLAEVLQVSQ